VFLEPFRKAKEQAEIYDWMVDFLLMSLVPETYIKREAGGRESRWNKVLRKTKIGVALKREAFLRDALAMLRENQHQEAKREFYRQERARHEEMMRQIRLDSGAKDVAIRPFVPGELKTSALKIRKDLGDIDPDLLDAGRRNRPRPGAE
jgi:hypothetical protein